MRDLSKLLTGREEEAVGWLCMGLDNRRIGAQMGVTSSYVNNLVIRAMERTGARNRTHLALIAVGHLILHPEDDRA